jgi:hypothetical protein
MERAMFINNLAADHGGWLDQNGDRVEVERNRLMTE